MTEPRRKPLSAEIQQARERGEKWCRSCEVFHPFSEFGKDASRKDGLRDHCREADRQKGRLRYAKTASDDYRSWFAVSPDGFTTRREALAKGLKEYFDGRPCPKGHIAPRRVDSCGCTECHKTIAKAWEAKGPSHPERLAAIEAKEVTFMGKPCPNGHDGLRLTRNGRCAHCARASVARWLSAHPEYDATGKTRERRRMDPFKHRANVARWKANNPEKSKATLARWIRQNPQRWRNIQLAGDANRRARKANNGGSFTADDVQDMLIEQDGHCAACGKVPDNLEIDHIMPIVRGGSSDPWNLQLLCLPCNRSKGGLHPDEWRRRLRLGLIIPKSHELL